MPYLDKDKQRECVRKYQADRRARFLAELGPCWWCGSDDRLEVDHINRADKVSHRIWTWAEDRLRAELAKCQILCKACHKLKTRQERRKPYVHGTMHCYQALECRCEPCRAANAARGLCGALRRKATKRVTTDSEAA